MKILYGKILTLHGNIIMLRTVQCWVWIGFRQCLLRASKLTQTFLFNIIRHIDSRVQCKSKQSARHWSCCIRILSVRHVNKHAVTSTEHSYCQRMLCLHSNILIAWMYVSLVGKQKLVGKKTYWLQWNFVNGKCILLGNSLFTVWYINSNT